MIEPPVWLPRIWPRFFLKIQHVHGQKMIDPPIWLTRIWPRFFFKDSTSAWSKMIDLPNFDRPGSHLEFFFKDSTCPWSKDDWPHNKRQTRLSPRIFLKIEHVHGQKMIDPSIKDRQGSHLEFFFKDSTCPWSKDDWAPSMTAQDLT